jgi:hypothetical protein
MRGVATLPVVDPASSEPPRQRMPVSITKSSRRQAPKVTRTRRGRIPEPIAVVGKKATA